MRYTHEMDNAVAFEELVALFSLPTYMAIW
jgi:hypothetical protein